MNIAWIGLGAIGTPMALATAKAGHSITAFDMNPAALEAVVPAISSASSAVEAVTGKDTVVIMVATGAQLESVLFGENGISEALTADTHVLVMSTVGPASVEACAERLAPITTHFVDAPVSGGVVRAASGDLLVMVGGAEADVAGVEPLLQAMASNYPVMGSRVGDGQRFKVVNQLLCGVHIAAAGEALALADSMGLDVKQCYEVLNTGAAQSFMFENRGERMVAEDFDNVKSALGIFVKDMGLVTEAAQQVGARVPLTVAAEALYAEGREAGYDRKDDSVVYELLRKK